MSLEDMRSMPHILKPWTLLMSLVFLIVAICVRNDMSAKWFPIVAGSFQLIACVAVFGLQMIDAVLLTTYYWPNVEIGYCLLFVVLDIVSVVIWLVGLFGGFDFMIMIAMIVGVVNVLSFGLIATINFRTRGSSSSGGSNNQATAGPGSYPSGVNPGV